MTEKQKNLVFVTMKIFNILLLLPSPGSELAENWVFEYVRSRGKTLCSCDTNFSLVISCTGHTDWPLLIRCNRSWLPAKDGVCEYGSYINYATHFRVAVAVLGGNVKLYSVLYRGLERGSRSALRNCHQMCQGAVYSCGGGSKG